jgi:hypothetical protein
MEMIAHEFTDSLSIFLRENPASNERDWLKQLDQCDLSMLVDLLRLIVEGRGVPGFDESECINKYSDAHLLAFRVANIGKKRRITTMSPERQIKLISRVLVDAQLTLINHKII